MTARRVILLAMHGSPPKDFPSAELAEFFRLHAALEHAASPPPETPRRYTELETRLRAWPRSPQNDPFHAASLALAGVLEKRLGAPVVVAFNEFCDPDLETGLLRAAGLAAEVVVVTPMLTPGGEHAEVDIPRAIDRARQAHPMVRFHYAWPIPLEATAALLAEQVDRTAPT